jgi:hypothetical protein
LPASLSAASSKIADKVIKHYGDKVREVCEV